MKMQYEDMESIMSHQDYIVEDLTLKNDNLEKQIIQMYDKVIEKDELIEKLKKRIKELE